MKTKAGTGSKNEITISELWEIVARRRVPVLVCMAVGLVVALVFSLLTPSKYEAVSRLSINYHGSSSPGAEMLAQAAGVVDPTTLETQVSILETDSLAWEVIKKLRLDQKPEALPRFYGIGPVFCQSAAADSIDSVGTECRERLLKEFQKRLHVQVVPRTEIVEIRYRSESRYLAAQVVDALASLYIESVFQSKYLSATKSSEWISGQLEGIRKDAEETARSLIAHQEQTGANNLEGAPNLVLARLGGLSQQLVGAEGDRIVKGARYQTALNGDPEALVSISDGTTLQTLHGQVAALENRYAELDAKFGESYPAVIQVNEQLAKAREALHAELVHTTEKLKDDYAAAMKSEDLLRAEVEQQQRLVAGSTEDWVQMSLLNRDMEASGELYKQVIKRLKTGGLLAADNGPDITVIDAASVSFRRAEPRRVLNATVGVLLGLAVGLALCGLIEQFDRRIRTMNDVSELCPVSGVGIISCIEEGGKDVRAGAGGTNVRSVRESFDELDPESADAFLSLRTSLLHAGAAAPPKVILVTSPLWQEGTAATSLNLAAAFARTNRSVLLVDADLRRGSLDRAVKPPSLGGLAASLQGADYRSCCASGETGGNPTLLPAGAGLANPPDLLDSARMRELIAHWREEYDVTIVNLPQLISKSDAVIVSAMADTVLLTVRAGHNRRKDIRGAMTILASAGANLHGAVVTDLRARGFFARTASWNDQTFNRPGMGYSNDSL
jgi:succinoglycan biosynthesis transport protein ExoP